MAGEQARTTKANPSHKLRELQSILMEYAIP